MIKMIMMINIKMIFFQQNHSLFNDFSPVIEAFSQSKTGFFSN